MTAKEIPQIYATTEFDEFIPHEVTLSKERAKNQNPVESLSRLVEAVEERNYLKYFPIHVSAPDKEGKRRIVDGNKRFYVARHLEVPLHYMEVDPSVSPAALAEAQGLQEKWTLFEYLLYWSAEDNTSAYTTLRFIANHGLRPTAVTAVQLLSGSVTRSTSVEQMVRRGEFRITNMDFATRIMEEINFLLHHTDKDKLHLTQLLIKAFCVMYCLKDFDVKVWHKAVVKSADTLENQATLRQNFDMLRKLHNGSRKSGKLIGDTDWRFKDQLKAVVHAQAPPAVPKT